MSGTSDRKLVTLLLGVPVAALLALVMSAVCIALAFGGTAGCGGGGEAATGTVEGVPARLAPIYEKASVKYRLGTKGPAILAAINKVETDFGRNLNVSSAGAVGWMQFMPETWASYGVDANGDGREDPSDPWDAIFAAARYMRASGAPGDWHRAILTYNHAEWYVEMVLGDAQRFQGSGTEAVGEECTAESRPAVEKMVTEADRLSALRPHAEYVWGGSHGLSPTPANGPFDCSSAVSHLLQIGGFKNPTMDTIALAGWGEPGPGRWVTIYVKPFEPEAHTFVEFMPGVTPPSKRYWGTSGFVEPGHGPGWILERTFSNGYLEDFELRHPPGL